MKILKSSIKHGFVKLLVLSFILKVRTEWYYQQKKQLLKELVEDKNLMFYSDVPHVHSKYEFN